MLPKSCKLRACINIFSLTPLDILAMVQSAAIPFHSSDYWISLHVTPWHLGDRYSPQCLLRLERIAMFMYELPTILYSNLWSLKWRSRTLRIWMKVGRRIVNMYMYAQIGASRSSCLFAVHNRTFRDRWMDEWTHAHTSARINCSVGKSYKVVIKRYLYKL